MYLSDFQFEFGEGVLQTELEEVGVIDRGLAWTEDGRGEVDSDLEVTTGGPRGTAIPPPLLPWEGDRRWGERGRNVSRWGVPDPDPGEWERGLEGLLTPPPLPRCERELLFDRIESR